MTEEWRDIKGYEGCYQVSNLGRVKSLTRKDRNGRTRAERILVNNKRSSEKDYLRVHLSKDNVAKDYSIHRLVAIAFIPNPNGYTVVNHLDNNPSNNNVTNLEWTTLKGNMEWASRQHRMHYNPQNLLKAQISKKIPVIAINSNGEEFYFDSQVEAAKRLNVKSGHIAAACRKEYGYKTVGGYQWKYADAERQKNAIPNKVKMPREEYLKRLSEQMKGNKFCLGKKLTDETKRKLALALGKRVIQYTKDGKKVAEYVSVNEAQRVTKISHIDDVVVGKRKTAGGYFWKRGEQNEK